MSFWNIGISHFIANILACWLSDTARNLVVEALQNHEHRKASLVHGAELSGHDLQGQTAALVGDVDQQGRHCKLDIGLVIMMHLWVEYRNGQNLIEFFLLFHIGNDHEVDYHVCQGSGDASSDDAHLEPDDENEIQNNMNQRRDELDILLKFISTSLDQEFQIEVTKAVEGDAR